MAIQLLQQLIGVVEAAHRFYLGSAPPFSAVMNASKRAGPEEGAVAGIDRIERIDPGHDPQRRFPQRFGSVVER